ncbi:MAG: T9SS type A sorting domain-containing protein, partial [Paludibacteraceae bacterium]|nr:T9SS type A sorting domain-containing protein [Paludibacteraceae bacterium]
VGCFALMDDPANDSKVKTNLKKAWDGQLMTGQYRYYDGLVHYLAMLHLCGSFKIWKPTPDITELTVDGNSYNGQTYTEETTIDAFVDCQLYKVTIKCNGGDKSDDINNVDGISIYPNPARNEFTISCNEDIKSVEMTNLAGQVVLSDSNSEIQVSLPAGTYIVRVTTANGNVYMKKLVIK